MNTTQLHGLFSTLCFSFQVCSLLWGNGAETGRFLVCRSPGFVVLPRMKFPHSIVHPDKRLFSQYPKVHWKIIHTLLTLTQGEALCLASWASCWTSQWQEQSWVRWVCLWLELEQAGLNRRLRMQFGERFQCWSNRISHVFSVCCNVELI